MKEKKYRVVMEGITESDDIIIEHNLTLKEAEKVKKECEEKDWLYYYVIKEEKDEQ